MIYLQFNINKVSFLRSQLFPFVLSPSPLEPQWQSCRYDKTHPALKCLYSSYVCKSLPASAPKLKLTWIQPVCCKVFKITALKSSIKYVMRNIGHLCALDDGTEPPSDHFSFISVKTHSHHHKSNKTAQFCAFQEQRFQLYDQVLFRLRISMQTLPIIQPILKEKR